MLLDIVCHNDHCISKVTDSINLFSLNLNFIMQDFDFGALCTLWKTVVLCLTLEGSSRSES